MKLDPQGRSPVRSLLVDGHGVAPSRVTTCAEFVDVASARPADRRTAIGRSAHRIVRDGHDLAPGSDRIRAVLDHLLRRPPAGDDGDRRRRV